MWHGFLTVLLLLELLAQQPVRCCLLPPAASAWVALSIWAATAGIWTLNREAIDSKLCCGSAGVMLLL
jgi:hypothetical protein